MNKNIFEGAKFGDKFLRRDGKIAIYHMYISNEWSSSNKPRHSLITDIDSFTVNPDGTYKVEEIDDEMLGWNFADDNKNLDIVSHYQEFIDENKLDELANNSLKNTQYYESANEFETMAYIDGYFNGYHKAQEE